MSHIQIIANQLQIKPSQVQSVIDLLDNENTIPFIARYRKEATGNLDEEQIRQIASEVERLRNLDKRRKTILTTIEEQGKLTPLLKEKILAAVTLTELEDYYQPFKPKRRTRATIAREKGLERLAESILRQGRTGKTADEMAQSYINEAVPTVEEALAGARDIAAEIISDHPEIRGKVRERSMNWASLTSKKDPDANDNRNIYESYYDFKYRLNRLKPHQVLAINRGERAKILKVKVVFNERDWKSIITEHFYPDPNSSMYEQLNMTIEDSASRLLLPAIERDLRSTLTEEAEKQAIDVFVANLKALLQQPPLSGHIVMGIDPGYRTGCKAAVVDQTGKVLETATIYPFKSDEERAQAIQKLEDIIPRLCVSLISIGNGTASRQTEQLIAEVLKKFPHTHYLITSEAGASVYSASPLAGKELPDMDVSMRGAVSIARRVQDPLSELVKIEPRAIGVGMYQHDVNQPRLSQALNGVVESVVNQVGVELNSASPSLLTYVAGIGPKLAENIIEHRDQNGPYASREALQGVSGLGPKAFEQCAGFLRIRDGVNPLDASAIHPESYPLAQKVLEMAALEASTPPEKCIESLELLKKERPLKTLTAELGTGLPTLEDIFEQLMRPGRDPRVDLPLPILRSDVLSIEDLSTGMKLKGTVRNVVDFGVFVDIGIKNDGLVHRTQIPRDMKPHIGDIVEVEILKIEVERGRISLKLQPQQ
jgi:uncharacterized protein